MLEREITEIEKGIIEENSEVEQLREKKKTVLASMFNKRSKGALIRARFSSLQEKDAPSSFFISTCSGKREKENLCYI